LSTYLNGWHLFRIKLIAGLKVMPMRVKFINPRVTCHFQKFRASNS